MRYHFLGLLILSTCVGCSVTGNPERAAAAEGSLPSFEIVFDRQRMEKAGLDASDLVARVQVAAASPDATAKDIEALQIPLPDGTWVSLGEVARVTIASD